MLHSSHSARVNDYVSALKQLHMDFRWPLPIISLGALKRISSGKRAFSVCKNTFAVD